MNLNELKKSSAEELANTASSLGIKTAAASDNSDLILAILRSHTKSGGAVTSSGTLEILGDGFGFLRGSKSDYSPSPQDIYVSPSQIRRFHLNTGDEVSGQVRPPKESERYFALLRVATINGVSADKAATSQGFTERKAIHSAQALALGKANQRSRLFDALCPIGKGQRALILAPQRCQPEDLLLDLAKALVASKRSLVTLLVAQRPEVVSDFEAADIGEVVASTFEEPAQKHVQVTDMVLESAKRSADAGKDVVVLVSSLTRLASAASQCAPGTSSNLPSGLSARGVQSAKRLFAAGRNLQGAGSVTLIAVAREDGESMDEYLRQELSESANAVLYLSEKAAAAGCALPLDIARSYNSDEERFLSEEARAELKSLRERLAGASPEELKAFEDKES